MSYEVFRISPYLELDAGWRKQYTADVLVQPPVNVGEGLARRLGAGVINLEVVSSDKKRTHLAITTPASRDSKPEHIDETVERLALYFNTDSTELPALLQTYREDAVLIITDAGLL